MSRLTLSKYLRQFTDYFERKLKMADTKYFIIDEETDHKHYKTEDEALTAAKRAVNGRRYTDNPYIVYEAKQSVQTLVPESVVTLLT